MIDETNFDPSSPEGNELFIRHLLTIIKEVRSQLRISEAAVKMVIPSAQEHTTAYYLHSVLHTLDKVLIACLRFNEDIPPQKEVEDMDTIPSCLLESWLDELQLWRRKINELIVALALWEATKTFTDAFVRHYLLLREYAGLSKAKEELLQVWGCDSKNFQYSADETSKGIIVIEDSIDINQAWYCRAKKAWQDRKEKEKKKPLADFKARLHNPLITLEPNEQLVLALSYEGAFGRLSEMIHTEIGGLPSQESNFDDLRAQISFLTLGSMCAIIRCARLQAFDSPSIQSIKSSLNDGKTEERIARFKIVRFEEGDYVIVLGELAQVIESRKAIGSGFVSYEVKFISKNPLPIIDKDCFPTSMLTGFARIKDSKDKVTAMLREVYPTREVSSEVLDEAIRESVLNAFQNFEKSEFTK